MKPRTEIIILIAVIAFLSSVFLSKALAQTSDNLIVLGGYKSIEVGYSYNNEDFLNFGFSVSAADSELLERRANRNDIYKKLHEFNNKVTPAGFFLVGATFDKISITGKSGIAYLSQQINGVQDKQKIYWAVGILLSHELTERCSLVLNYDNINSAQIGVKYKF